MLHLPFPDLHADCNPARPDLFLLRPVIIMDLGQKKKEAQNLAGRQEAICADSAGPDALDN